MSSYSLYAGPYYCSQGSTLLVPTCAVGPDLIYVPELVAFAEFAAAAGNIDQTSGLYNDQVFLVSGLFDYTIVTGKPEL